MRRRRRECPVRAAHSDPREPGVEGQRSGLHATLPLTGFRCARSRGRKGACAAEARSSAARSPRGVEAPCCFRSAITSCRCQRMSRAARAVAATLPRGLPRGEAGSQRGGAGRRGRDHDPGRHRRALPCGARSPEAGDVGAELHDAGLGRSRSVIPPPSGAACSSPRSRWREFAAPFLQQRFLRRRPQRHRRRRAVVGQRLDAACGSGSGSAATPSSATKSAGPTCRRVAAGRPARGPSSAARHDRGALAEGADTACISAAAHRARAPSPTGRAQARSSRARAAPPPGSPAAAAPQPGAATERAANRLAADRAGGLRIRPVRPGPPLRSTSSAHDHALMCGAAAPRPQRTTTVCGRSPAWLAGPTPGAVTRRGIALRGVERHGFVFARAHEAFAASQTTVRVCGRSVGSRFADRRRLRSARARHFLEQAAQPLAIDDARHGAPRSGAVLRPRAAAGVGQRQLLHEVARRRAQLPLLRTGYGTRSSARGRLKDHLAGTRTGGCARVAEPETSIPLCSPSVTHWNAPETGVSRVTRCGTWSSHALPEETGIAPRSRCSSASMRASALPTVARPRTTT